MRICLNTVMGQKNTHKLVISGKTVHVTKINMFLSYDANSCKRHEKMSLLENYDSHI